MISVRARSAAELLITAWRQRTVVGMLRADRISAGEQAPAAEVMQPGPTTVRAHENLDATRQRMNEHHPRRHPARRRGRCRQLTKAARATAALLRTTVATPLPGLVSKLLAVPESAISGTTAVGRVLPGQPVRKLVPKPRAATQLSGRYPGRSAP